MYLLLIMLVLAPGQGLAEDFSRFNGKVLIGMEVELWPERLAQLVRHFDFTRLSPDRQAALRREISDEAMGPFELTPDSFHALSPELQHQLGGDLALTKSLIVMEGGDAADRIRFQWPEFFGRHRFLRRV